MKINIWKPTASQEHGSYGVIAIGSKQWLVAIIKDQLVGLYCNSDEALARLKKRWPRCVWDYSNKDLVKLRNLIEGYWQRGSLPDLSILLKGTDFQLAVWQELLSIGRGNTVTYRQLAERIQMPKAYRAVGTAVGANPVSILIPCHRVVPQSGGAGQYAWGYDIKRELLEREGVFIPKELAQETSLF